MSKAKKYLKWRNILSFEEISKLTAEWYKNYYENKLNISHFSSKQIYFYEKCIKREIEDRMKVVILAGGRGTRISEYTKSIPKPMVKIGSLLIIVIIMKLYAKYGYDNFYVALGYKRQIIKSYFKKTDLNGK